MKKISIIVHGGAWAIPDDFVEDNKRACTLALDAGWNILKSGGSAVDAVEAAVRILEDAPSTGALCYDALTNNFAVGETVTGQISGATGSITAVNVDVGATSGCLELESVTGVFQDNESVTGSSSGSATVNGSLFESGEGFQNVLTYTVGFMGDQAGNLFLINTSNNGNGNKNLYDTSDEEYGMYHFTADSPNGTYAVGDEVTIRVNFSEAVIATSSPVVLILNASGSSNCSLDLSVATSSASCIYTVALGDEASDLTVTNVTTGPIYNLGGEQMVNLFPASNLGDNSNIVVDGAAPTVSSIDFSKNSFDFQSKFLLSSNKILKKFFFILPSITPRANGVVFFCPTSIYRWRVSYETFCSCCIVNGKAYITHGF